MDTIEGRWAGDSIRFARKDQRWPELFLYSKTDWYLPHKYLEDKVITPHLEGGRDVTSKCWNRSNHVCHLKKYGKEYQETVHDFLAKIYFDKL